MDTAIPFAMSPFYSGESGVGLSAVPYTGTVVLFTGRRKYDTGQPVPYWIGTRGGTVRVRTKVRTVTALVTGCHS